MQEINALINEQCMNRSSMSLMKGRRKASFVGIFYYASFLSL
ncbi:hypothetical protein D931_02957 [Enterococcus faecium 13.SD.W.09]|nr:hypothetical protein D931_02957 [Enterococcus faecium 13.SD.W.09]